MVNRFSYPLPKRLPVIFYLLLGLQAVSTFMSETKLISSIRNNVGVFELSAVVLMGITLLFLFHHQQPLRAHPLIILFGLWFTVALTSLINIHTEALAASITAVITILFQFAFTLILYNLLSLYPGSLRYLLFCMTIATALMGVWVFVEQVFIYPGDFMAAGGFRNRTHAGIYMMAAFWIVLIYSFWPGLKLWEKLVSYLALSVALYTIATSLRQSVYVAMMVGMVGLVFVSFFGIRGQQRFYVSGMVALFVLTIASLYLFDDQRLTQISLFKQEIARIDSRLSMVVTSQNDPEFDASFDARQRQGAIQAFFDHPVLGIGWMGFYRSEYSPTGHELHSSPLRLVAELGVFGIAIYVAFLIIVFSRAIKLFLKARGTPYQLSALVLLVALGAQAVSHYYNRMFTDRPYWVLLVVFLTFEYIVQHLPQKEDELEPARPVIGSSLYFRAKARPVEHY